MYDEIKGNDEIILQPYSSAIRYTFEVTQNSSSIANDGFLPHEVDISSVSASAFNIDDGSNVTGELVSTAPTVNDNIIAIKLQYPSTSGDGRYKLTFYLTLSDGSNDEFDVRRIKARTK